jgi:hypothetical protein
MDVPRAPFYSNNHLVPEACTWSSPRSVTEEPVDSDVGQLLGKLGREARWNGALEALRGSTCRCS